MKCRFFKSWMACALDDRRPLPARIRRHLAACAGCREHHEGQSSIVRNLRAEISQTSAEPSPFLRARILNEIASTSRREAPASLVRWAWAGGIVALLALGAIVMRSQTNLATDRMAGNKAASASAPASAAALLEATGRIASGGRLLQMVTNFDQPLQTEMSLVIGDARAALRSLQTDFIPAQLLARSE